MSADVARTRPAVVDSTAVERVLTFSPPARRISLDGTGVGLLLALLVVLVLFAGLIVNLTAA